MFTFEGEDSRKPRWVRGEVRTRTLNFYRIEGAFYFVDLPGYGYARVSKKEMAAWRALAESYLFNRSALRLVVVIIEVRHGASPLDLQMTEWLAAHRYRFVVVASKADKLKKGERRLRSGQAGANARHDA